MSDKKVILNAEQVELKIQRLSNEIAERYYGVKTVYVFGIEGRGYKLADRILKQTQALTKTEIILSKISINKENPINSVKIDDNVIQNIKGKDILLIDDVLNSGKTLFYALQPFVNIPLNSLRVLVLVNRSHQHFPVYPDFVGITLSTTYQNHIEAVINTKRESCVFLVNR